jgi:hypothetical protein
MKTTAVVLIAMGGLLAGCVGYEDSNRSPYRDSTAYRYDRDRDGDGVSNRWDSDRDGDGVRNTRDQNPDNPRRY